MHYFTLNSIKGPDKCPSFWSRDKSFLGPGKCPVTFTIRNFGIKGLVRDQNLLVVSNTVVPVSRVRLPGSS